MHTSQLEIKRIILPGAQSVLKAASCEFLNFGNAVMHRLHCTGEIGAIEHTPPSPFDSELPRESCPTLRVRSKRLICDAWLGGEGIMRCTKVSELNALERTSLAFPGLGSRGESCPPFRVYSKWLVGDIEIDCEVI